MQGGPLEKGATRCPRHGVLSRRMSMRAEMKWVLSRRSLWGLGAEIGVVKKKKSMGLKWAYGFS